MESARRYRTALVLGGGGMFGAYQAGVWAEISRYFQPDIVIGASIGAINGWAVAAGGDPEEWVAQWLDFREASVHRFRFPRSPVSGCVDREAFEAFMRGHFERFQPRLPMGVVLTDTVRLKPFVVTTPEVTWRHLAASCGVPLILPQYRLDGRWCMDGGLLASLPLWAAADLGVEAAIGVNIMPRKTPGWLLAGRALLHAAARWAPPTTNGLRAVVVEHAKPLGPLAETTRWRRETSERWVALGREDARRARPAIEAALAGLSSSQ